MTAVLSWWSKWPCHQMHLSETVAVDMSAMLERGAHGVLAACLAWRLVTVSRLVGSHSLHVGHGTVGLVFRVRCAYQGSEASPVLPMRRRAEEHWALVQAAVAGTPSSWR